MGCEYPSKEFNIGSLLRSSLNFGAKMLFTVGAAYKRQGSDVFASTRHIPMLHFINWKDYLDHAPQDWTPVAVELVDDAVDLPDFRHPRSAVYFFGPEGGNLSQEALDLADHRVKIPTTGCLNLGVAAAVVMYDRLLKKQKQQRDSESDSDSDSMP